MNASAVKKGRTVIPGAERGSVFLVNRVDGMTPVHYGTPLCPMCRIAGVDRPWLTSWFLDDVTCKRCLKALPPAYIGTRLLKVLEGG